MGLFHDILACLDKLTYYCTMEVPVEVHTIPITISREQAAINIGTTAAIIDKATKNNKIDFAWYGRNKLIIVNERWVAFTKRYK